MIETDRYVVLTVDQWRRVVAVAPRALELLKPYGVNECSVFDGRCVVVVATLGL